MIFRISIQSGCKVTIFSCFKTLYRTLVTASGQRATAHGSKYQHSLTDSQPQQHDYKLVLELFDVHPLFVSLQSRYGLTGSSHVQTPFPKSSSTIPASSKNPIDPAASPKAPAPSSSTSAYAPSLGTTLSSTDTVTSTTSIYTPEGPPQKDYEAALGSLQSRYASGGNNHLPFPKSSGTIPISPPLSSSSAYNGGSHSGESKSQEKRSFFFFKSMFVISAVAFLCLHLPREVKSDNASIYSNPDKQHILRVSIYLSSYLFVLISPIKTLLP